MGEHSAPIYLPVYYLRRILISRPPRVFRRFKRRSCYSDKFGVSNMARNLTHWDWVRIFIRQLDDWTTTGTMAPAPSDYLNQYWTIVNLTIGSKSNLERNTINFMWENEFDNVSSKWPPFYLCLNMLIFYRFHTYSEHKRGNLPMPRYAIVY